MTAFHPAVKQFLDGEIRMEDLPPELQVEARAAARLLAAVDRTPVSLSPALEARVMATVRQAGAPGRGWWRRLVEPREIRVRVRPWALLPALAAAAALVLLLRTPRHNAAVAVQKAPDSVYVRFVLYAPRAHRVTVAGTFNQWDATAAPLASTGEPGVWTTTVALPVGEHQYAFVVDGRRWVNDPAAPMVDDGFGRRNSVVAVTRVEARAL
jgi:Glycogen recognition site of AMP-activated protein kinase